MPPIQHFAPPPGINSPPLSFAARVGDLLFVSGIPGFDDNGALPDGFEAQFGFVMKNIKRVLDEAGATLRDLVKVNVLLTRPADVATMNKLYAEAFGALSRPHHLRRAGAAEPCDADRDRGRGVAFEMTRHPSNSVPNKALTWPWPAPGLPA
jgi:2-iminobutanoate/2-iminopropanoate deaminase